MQWLDASWNGPGLQSGQSLACIGVVQKGFHDMATLVLGGLGAALGGGVGGLLGTFIGQTIDGNVLGSSTSGRSRPANLPFQSSTYGAQVPRIYGTMRVAGAVVWATDLEAAPAAEGSKGQASGGGYSYSASFAVALSSRQACRVGRIWADGKLLRGSSGDLKVATKLRFYSGDEDQSVDPLIASVEGIANTPAYRGTALAVFEQLQLLEFGNRVPVLTFELEADPDDPTSGMILADMSAGLISDGPNHTLGGYAGLGATLGDAIAPLLEVERIQLLDGGDRLTACSNDQVFVVDEHELGCGTGAAEPRKLLKRKPSVELPTRVSVRYYDAALDYQAGEQQACWSSDPRPSRRVELPATLTATSAKSLAHAILTDIWSQREKVTFRLPFRYIQARVGDRLSVAGDGEWLIARTALEGWVISLECRRTEAEAIQIPAEPGRRLAVVDQAAEPSDIVLLDLPALDELASEPQVRIAASGGQKLWRALPVTLGCAGLAMEQFVVSPRAVIGRTCSALPPGYETLLDEVSSLIVELRDDDWLQSCSSDDLLAGANLAAVGSELLQFAKVEPLGQKRFRLSRLLRARYGTEWGMVAHELGDRFVLLRSSTLTKAPVPRTAIGQDLQAVGSGLGDDPVPGTAQITFHAESLRPPAPSHLRVARGADGLEVRWVRRSRAGYGWDDFVDAPLGEEAERYIVSLSGGTVNLSKSVSEERCTISPAELASFSSNPIVISVVQSGTFAVSRPATISVEYFL